MLEKKEGYDYLEEESPKQSLEKLLTGLKKISEDMVQASVVDNPNGVLENSRAGISEKVLRIEKISDSSRELREKTVSGVFNMIRQEKRVNENSLVEILKNLSLFSSIELGELIVLIREIMFEYYPGDNPWLVRLLSEIEEEFKKIK